METVFSLSGLLVLPLWAAMILVPGSRWTLRVMCSPWSVAPAAALYAALVLPLLGAVLPVVSRPELARVADLLGRPDGATVAWVHFLAFDLFVGRWAYLDSRDRGISAWVMAPVLVTVLMLGPLGLLLYLGVRGSPMRHRATRRPLPREAGRPSAAVRVEQAFRGAFRGAFRVDRPLAVVAALMVPLFLLSLVGIAIDSRTIAGAPAWVKPMKFAISISIYSFSLLWMLGMVQGHRRVVRVVGGVTALAFVVEWVVIAIQALRGTTSHFNVATPLDAALFSAMGSFVVALWVANLAAAVLLLRQHFDDRAFAWSLRLGLLLSLVGGLMATPMLGPTPEQLAVMQSGGRVETVGAHGVGVRDGGAGLPVVGWSTQGGDLRVPHFFGLHGLQVLPLIGFLLGRVRRLRAGSRLALVWVAGMGYLGVTGILFWQALRGESVASPGAATMAALGVIAVAVLLVVGGVLFGTGRRGRERTELRLARVG